MNIFERYQDLVSKKNSVLDKYVEQGSKNTELEMRTGNLPLSMVNEHERLYKEYSSLFEKSKVTADRIVQFSLFLTKDIVPSLAEIVSVFEGKKYSFVTALVDFETGKRKVGLIADNKCKKDVYNYKELENLEKENKVLVLTYSAEFNFFYSYNNAGNLQVSNNIGKFTYVKDFLDRLICYKEVNGFGTNGKNLSQSMIYGMKRQFILENADTIIEGYEQKDKSQLLEIKSLTEEVNDRKKLLQKIKNIKAEQES